MEASITPSIANRNGEISHTTDHQEKRKLGTAEVAELVREHPGCTSAELAEKTGADRFALARRLPDAATLKKPLLYKGAPRACNVTGRAAFTWWPIPAPGKAA